MQGARYLEEDPDKRTKIENADTGDHPPDGRVRTHERAIVEVEQAKHQEHHGTGTQTTATEGHDEQRGKINESK